MPTLAILLWPIIAMVLFYNLGRAKGMIWTVVAGYLFLPEAWSLDFPAVPRYGKSQAISVGLLLGLLITRSTAARPPQADRVFKFAIGLVVVVLVVAPFVTALTNRDVLTFGWRVLPAIGLWDAQSYLFSTFLILVPFFVARRHLHDPEQHREVLRILVILALAYTPLVLFELRLSPQLNNIVYGYFPHAWDQHIRGGGWRPLVFLSHGLELGFFLLMATLAVVGLVRSSGKENATGYFGVLILLLLLLPLSKNLGALALCLLFLPVAFMLKGRIHRRIAVVVALLFLAYPLTRDIYAETSLVLFEAVSERGAGSLGFRLDHEARLLAHALERPWGGWGPWGRWRLYDETGIDVTVSDGVWVIQLGEWGFWGFLGLFGLMATPLLFMWRASKHEKLPIATSMLLLMMSTNLIYMVPNSTVSPITWMVAGALAGYVQFAPGRTRTAGTTAQKAPTARYTRFGPHGAPAADPTPRSRFTPDT